MPIVTPNFQRYTPQITIISLSGNNFFYIPDEYIMDLQLEGIDILDNTLETIPDLFDQTPQKLKVAGNPLRCNQSLCWVRLWARKKTVVLTDIESAVCQSPGFMTGKSLLSVDPVKMACYKCECYIYCIIQIFGNFSFPIFFPKFSKKWYSSQG